MYHRHVMGDGYQLNALLVKGTFFAGLMICAIDSILNVYIPLLHTGLVLLCAFPDYHAGAFDYPPVCAVQP